MSASIRDDLLSKGFYPEVLPPCFDSSDLIRAFRGILLNLEKNRFTTRSSNYIRYSGTKHDGNRRLYSTANPVPYYYLSNFISKNWTTFEKKFSESVYSLNSLRLGDANEDRAVVVPTLSDLANKTSSKIKYAPYVVKTDIAQFFPSIYTHTIPWVAHGVDISKANRQRNSNISTFNELDWYVQQGQNGQTRGVLVGPDGYRIIAEFISCEIDKQLFNRIGDKIVGAVRHVDDFYIGVKSEIDALAVLSELRDVLQNYELQINDSKTKILSGLETIDDAWAQELRQLNIVNFYSFRLKDYEDLLNHAIDKAYDISKSIKSESPIKLILRRFDEAKVYDNESWVSIEPKLQRILYHYPHCIDYICLLVVKRYALNKSLDNEAWLNVINLLIEKYIAFNHVHELCWLVWTMIVCKFNYTIQIIEKISKIGNSYINSLLIVAYKKGLCVYDPKIKLGSNLSTTDENWYLNLVARSSGYTAAKFSGAYISEFEHLSTKKVQLIDFSKHIQLVSSQNIKAISKSKYGYDAEDENEIEDDDMPF